MLEDDYLFEVSWDGEIVWEWLSSDHVDELGLPEEARNAIYRASGFNEDRQSFDWLHINAAAYVGPNQWYDGGDERFHPDNIMLSVRRPNIIVIIDRTGAIVWRMGPDYRVSTALSEIGQIIGRITRILFLPDYRGRVTFWSSTMVDRAVMATRIRRPRTA